VTSAQAPNAGGTLLQAVAVTTLGVLPAFLVGALAVQIRADLDIGPARLGFAAIAPFAVSGICARLLGRLVQRIGAAKGIAASAVLAATALGGAGLAPSFGVLIIALVVGGLACSPASSSPPRSTGPHGSLPPQSPSPPQEPSGSAAGPSGPRGQHRTQDRRPHHRSPEHCR